MIRALAWVKQECGPLAQLAIFILTLGVLFYVYGLKPLEERNRQLARELLRTGPQGTLERTDLLRVAAPGATLASFYKFFDREEGTIDWLAKLYGIGKEAGVEPRAVEYRLIDTKQRLDRYQLTVPLVGSYAQIRNFIEMALSDIPVLSLDQVSFRRRRANDTRIEAELVFTLHLLPK